MFAELWQARGKTEYPGQGHSPLMAFSQSWPIVEAKVQVVSRGPGKSFFQPSLWNETSCVSKP